MLSCDGEVSCCCLSPDPAHLAFAGLEEGSVVLWDLRERQILHQIQGKWRARLSLLCRLIWFLRFVASVRTSLDPTSLVLRSPSFITDNQICENHEAPVKRITVLHAADRPAFLQVRFCAVLFYACRLHTLLSTIRRWNRVYGNVSMPILNAHRILARLLRQRHTTLSLQRRAAVLGRTPHLRDVASVTSWRLWMKVASSFSGQLSSCSR